LDCNFRTNMQVADASAFLVLTEIVGRVNCPPGVTADKRAVG